MTIKDTVKAAIATLPGNKTFRQVDLPCIHHPDGAEDRTLLPSLNPSQVARAIRDLPHVQRDGKGNYRVKGRRVPCTD